MKQLPTIIMATFAIVLFSIFLSLHSEMKTMSKDLQYYQGTYLRKQGATSLWDKSGKMISYDLRSFDSGRTWYAVHTDDDKVIVDGAADTVYPGLMKEIQASDDLYYHVKTNGAINLENSNDVSLLKAVGFVLKTNK